MLVQNRPRLLIAIALATGILTQALPPTKTAYAQDFTDTEIANYARAVIEIEAARQATYEAASDILAAADSDIDILDTRLSCNATRVRDMPDIPKPDRVDLRITLVNFCNRAREIADEHALSAQQFNQIRAAYRDDSALAERIQAEISEL